jgi:hypothetical protein
MAMPTSARRARRGFGLLALALLPAAVLAPAALAAPVGLGTTESFSVLGGSAVTNTGPTVMTGDLGVSPGTAISGFPPGLVSGAVHANDAVAGQAKNDLVTAFDDAAGRSSTAAVAGDLAGLTLTAGVYTSATSLGLSGDLTLDAQGDPNAVFVFQAGSTLTTASGSRVLLQGGAQACNVFWEVGSSATIGTASRFTGNILALTSISLTTGATIDGRVLARNGAVTLDTNILLRSTCTRTAADGGGTGGTPTGGTDTGAGAGGTTGPGGTSPAANGTGTTAARRHRGTGGRTTRGRSRRTGANGNGNGIPVGLTTRVTSRPPSRIGCVSARLGGRVRPGAAASTYRFQFGTTKAYGRRTANGHLRRGTRAIAVNAQAQPLISGTTYHYRLVSVRPGGATRYGADRTFRTSGVRACNTQAPARTPQTPQGFTG